MRHPRERKPVETDSRPDTVPEPLTRVGEAARVLALQRTAGNGAVVQMLAQRRLGAPMLQRSIDGYDGKSFDYVCKDLGEMGIDVSSQSRRAKLKELFDATKGYDLGEVLDELDKVNASAPAPSPTLTTPAAAAPPKTIEKSEKSEDSDEDLVYEDDDESWFGEKKKENVDPDYLEFLEGLGQGVRAVVVWAGSKLLPSIIKELKAHDIAGKLKKNEERTDVVAMLLAKDIKFESFFNDIQQALDQELKWHTKAVRKIVARLGRFGIQPTVLRPADDLLLVPRGQHIDPEWSTFDNPKQMHGLAPSPGEKTLLITVGHGAEGGMTAFPGAVKTGLTIATELELDAPADALMYIPLQCFPQHAVRRWTTETGRANKAQPSASIPSEEKSSDNAMLDWIKTDMEPALIDWLKRV